MFANKQKIKNYEQRMAIWNRTEQILKNQTSSRHEVYRS